MRPWWAQGRSTCPQRATAATPRASRRRVRLTLWGLRASGVGCPVPDLFPVLRRGRSVRRVLVLRPRELPCAHVFRIGGRGARDLLGEVRVSLDELWSLAGGLAEHVVQDQ